MFIKYHFFSNVEHINHPLIRMLSILTILITFQFSSFTFHVLPRHNLLLIEEGPFAYLGYGEPLIGFCPYFLHEKSSEGISANLLLTAGTLMVLFILSFLTEENKNEMKQFD